MKKAEKGKIPEGSGIIMSTGYGKNWEKTDYLQKCPFLNKEAMDYLIDKKPFIVAFDTPSAENDVHPENAFERYFNADILTVTACINLERIKKYKVKLTVMPLNILIFAYQFLLTPASFLAICFTNNQVGGRTSRYLASMAIVPSENISALVSVQGVI